MNCYQLARHFYKKELEIDLIDMNHIRDDATRTIHKEILRQSIGWNISTNPKLYDLVLMNNCDHHSVINHIGVYIGDDKILHTSKATGCIITDKKLLNIKGYASYKI